MTPSVGEHGTSSAGKTTLARAVQDESDTPFVYWGSDTLFSLVPANRGGGRDGPLSRDGFWYDRTGDDVDALSGLEVLLVHDHSTTCDTTVDSTTGTPAELARAVLRGQPIR
ncbi:chloramphenicol phosphotransferase CPT family protein [Saccharothrix luteola]|uniref:chloramphenicol phosphotransferase CPT family protein n=1 Tax=Saccharothrix luteola TaxID=2893018 RepID=UPI001E3ADFF4|nr:chloramphenicol phosphotransferase CPT family protein [Saccharothrix luteola]MCC8242999.1 chloramphenicol phosphotransferase CPT family protein [Saccharothrix luteola]